MASASARSGWLGCGEKGTAAGAQAGKKGPPILLGLRVKNGPPLLMREQSMGGPLRPFRPFFQTQSGGDEVRQDDIIRRDHPTAGAPKAVAQPEPPAE